jgi:hypothetical protein
MMLPLACRRKHARNARVSEMKSNEERTPVRILDRGSRIRRLCHAAHLHNSRLDYFENVTVPLGRSIGNRRLRQGRGGNGMALPRTRLNVELCADRPVTTDWTESIHMGER